MDKYFDIVDLKILKQNSQYVTINTYSKDCIDFLIEEYKLKNTGEYFKKVVDENIEWVYDQPGLVKKIHRFRLTKLGCQFFSCPSIYNYKNNIVNLTNIDKIDNYLTLIKSMSNDNILNQYQYDCWFQYYQKTLSKKKISAPKEITYYNGKTVLENVFFKKYLEFPILRNSNPIKGLTDVPPNISLHELGKFSLTSDYCLSMGVSYNRGDLSDGSCDDCYRSNWQIFAELFIGKLYRECTRYKKKRKIT